MKLIIDIPEEDYVFVKRQVADGITNPLKICIANGTPLDGVLQEIRQEILEQGKDDVCAEKHGCIDEILEIIDKHIGDTE